MRRLILRLALILLLLSSACAVIFARPGPARAQAEAPTRVVIKPLKPFVFAEGETYRGFSIDLWEEVADRLNLDYEYVYVDTVTEQLDAVREGRGDLGITGITITKEREQALDFSLPYFRSGLQILTTATSNTGQWVTPLDMLRQAFSSPVFYQHSGRSGRPDPDCRAHLLAGRAWAQSRFPHILRAGRVGGHLVFGGDPGDGRLWRSHGADN